MQESAWIAQVGEYMAWNARDWLQTRKHRQALEQNAVHPSEMKMDAHLKKKDKKTKINSVFGINQLGAIPWQFCFFFVCFF